VGTQPGRELKKEYREIAEHLVSVQGWTYRTTKRHPVLVPRDKTKPQLRVATTPTSSPRALKNFIADVRRRGGVWPPPREETT
jgi:hypothetical protein